MPFNIFHFLNLERREDVLHTPMIAGLLNLEEPEMGKLFLEEFFKGLRQKEPEIPPTPELLKGTWRVETEKIVGTTEKGYIDILMTSSQLNCAIIIENKVDASEGHLQVHKYAEWGRQHYGQYWIFLLSPEGREATSVAGEKCVPISYALIRDWLARCVGRVKDPQMKYMVECYLEVVSGLVPIKPVVSTQTMENKLIPPKQYTDTTLQFLATLTNYLNRKPELQNLAFVLDEDTYFRKYHAVIAIHKPFQQMSEKKLVWMRIEVMLSNKAWTGVYLGYHWRNCVAGDMHREVRKLPEIAKLDEFGQREKHYPNTGAIRNQWLSYRIAISKSRLDERLLGALSQNPEMHCSRIYDRVLDLFSESGNLWYDLNKKILELELG